jgi:propionyl-CoA synthetase
MRHSLHEGLRDAYARTYDDAARDPEWFWGHAARQLHWDVPPALVLDRSTAPLYRWFTGGMLNTCYNAIDRHVEGGRAEQAAVIYDSPVTGIKRTLTYRELQAEVALFAGVLTSLGVTKGDRVVIYMPMTPEALIAMYGCARIGAVHSVVFGGFASHELAVRIEDASPKVVVSASCGVEVSRVVDYKVLLDKALELSSHKPAHVITLQRPQRLCTAPPGARSRLARTDGARPSRAVRPGAGHRSAVHPLHLGNDRSPQGSGARQRRACGRAALVHAARVRHGPRGGVLGRERRGVGGRAFLHRLCPPAAGMHDDHPRRKAGGDAGRRRVLAGDPGTQGQRPVHGADRHPRHQEGRSAGPLLQAVRHLVAAGVVPGGRASRPRHLPLGARPAPAPRRRSLVADGDRVARGCQLFGDRTAPGQAGLSHQAGPRLHGGDRRRRREHPPAGKEGAVTLRLPLPPGTLSSLWQDDERFISTYLSKYPGRYLTGDGGYIDEDGYLFIMGRIDDVIIVAGHNLSTGSMEQALSAHPDVAECAVFGVKDALKTQLPLGLAVLKSGVTRSADVICEELVQAVRLAVGPVANFRKVAIVARLPKTRSGKVLRGTMRKIADGEAFAVPPTIDDPATLDEVRVALQSLGYARETDAPIGG